MEQDHYCREERRKFQFAKQLLWQKDIDVYDNPKLEYDPIVPEKLRIFRRRKALQEPKPSCLSRVTNMASLNLQSYTDPSLNDAKLTLKSGREKIVQAEQLMSTHRTRVFKVVREKIPPHVDEKKHGNGSGKSEAAETKWTVETPKLANTLGLSPTESAETSHIQNKSIKRLQTGVLEILANPVFKNKFPLERVLVSISSCADGKDPDINLDVVWKDQNQHESDDDDEGGKEDSEESGASEEGDEMEEG
jgi:hypothetical protein